MTTDQRNARRRDEPSREDPLARRLGRWILIVSLLTVALLVVGRSGATLPWTDRGDGPGAGGEVGEGSVADPMTPGRLTGRRQARGPGFRLASPHPHPFTEEVRLEFVLEAAVFEDRKSDDPPGNGPGERAPVRVSLRIYDLFHREVGWAAATTPERLRGRLVRDLAYREPGRYRARWDGRDSSGRRLPQGAYFARLRIGSEDQVRKLLMAR